MDRLSSDPPAPTRESRLLLPQATRLRVVATHHELCCSHLGVDYTTRAVQTWAWWPGIVSQTANYVSSCQKCRQKRFPAKPVKPSKRYIKSSGFVGVCICIDFFGPMPAGSNEETYCLTAIDLFSKYLFAIPIKGKSAQVVAAAPADTPAPDDGDSKGEAGTPGFFSRLRRGLGRTSVWRPILRGAGLGCCQ